MPTFSVIIPCYNRAGLIGQTLRSVLDGDVLPDEIIVVDDGSTDGSQDEVKSFGEAVTLIEQQNAGPGAARANGAEHATGDYLCFLDSDDLWFAWTLRVYDQLTQKYDRPAIVLGHAQHFTDQAECDRVPEPDTRADRFDHYLATASVAVFISGSAMVIRRDVLLEHGNWNTQPINAEDCLLMLRMGLAQGFVLSRVRTFGYRRHDGSLISMSDRTLAGQKLMLQMEKQGELPGTADWAMSRRRIITRHLRPTCMSLLAAGRSREAWALYRATLGWHLALGRFKFLLGFPIQAIVQRV